MSQVDPSFLPGSSPRTSARLTVSALTPRASEASPTRRAALGSPTAGLRFGLLDFAGLVSQPAELEILWLSRVNHDVIMPHS